MSVGMMPSSAEALVVVTSMSRSPCRTLIATGTVWLALDDEERQRDEELVPRPDEEEDEQHRQRRPADREDDPPQDLPARRRRRCDAASRISFGNVPYTAREQVGAERRLDHREDDDHRPHVVVEADLLEHVVQRVEQRLLRQQVGEQEQQHDPRAALARARCRSRRRSASRCSTASTATTPEMKIEFHSFSGKLTRFQKFDDAVEVERRRAARAGRRVA